MMVTTRMVKASWLSRAGVPEGRKGPGVELGQCITEAVHDNREHYSVMCNTQKIASRYLISSECG